METKQRVRHGLVWPVMLIGAGVVLLLSNLGVLPWGIWQTLVGLWPVLLIVAGLDLLLGRRSMWGALLAAVLALAVLVGALYVGLNQARTPGVYRTETVSQALNGARDAVVEIDFGTGLLQLNALPEDSGKLIEGSVDLSPNERMTQNSYNSGDTLHYTLGGNDAWEVRFPNPAGTWPGDKQWKLALSRDVPIRLRINSGVGGSMLDLSQLTIPDLSVKGGVGQMDLTLPQHGSSNITFDSGIGEVTVRVPTGTAAQIHVDGGLGGTVADGNFERADNTFTTPGYASATDRCDVQIKGGIGKITVRQVSPE